MASGITSTNSLKHDPLWSVTFACFMLAALTGSLYRYGMIGTLPWELSLDNIRHAHSHLMFFSWAAPLPLYIFLLKMKGWVNSRDTAIRWMKISLWACLAFGLISYPFFLLYGYHPVPVGSSSLPLSVIMSGMVMLSWYLYMGSYLTLRKKLSNRTKPWMEASMFMLFICSLGAWGVALVQALFPEAHLMMKGLTHFFLAAFTEGWVVLALLSMLLDALPLDKRALPLSQHTLIGMIAIGAPLTFPYGISETLLSPLLLVVARFGGLVIATALLTLLYGMFKSATWEKSLWKWVLGLLLLKALMQLSASLLPSGFWLSEPTFRVLYLHLLLLGAFTLGMVGWLHHNSEAPDRPYTLFAWTVAILLVSLVTLSPLWPGSWRGMWIFYFVWGATLLPVLALAYEWITLKVTYGDTSHE